MSYLTLNVRRYLASCVVFQEPREGEEKCVSLFWHTNMVAASSRDVDCKRTVVPLQNILG